MKNQGNKHNMFFDLNTDNFCIKLIANFMIKHM